MMPFFLFSAKGAEEEESRSNFAKARYVDAIRYCLYCYLDNYSDAVACTDSLAPTILKIKIGAYIKYK